MSKPTVWDSPEPQPSSVLCPGVGIYEGVDFATYCHWDAINHSRLSRIDKSPLNTQIGRDLSGSAAIRFGSLVHAGQLEPDSVDMRYAVMPDFENDSANVTAAGKPSRSAATEYVKEARKSFAAKCHADGKEVVTQSEMTAMQNALAAISACSQAADRLVGGRPELSIVWQDPATGLRCKARIDYQRPECLVDLKTSRDDSNRPLPESFEYSLWTYRYDTQAAWYQVGWEVLTGERLPFWFVVLGTGQPMQCVAAPVGEITLRAGRDKNIERMALYKYCHDRNEWPGYESPVIFELPEKYLPSEVSCE